MAEKLILTPEQEAKKEAWLKELADFIVEANGKTYAAGGVEVEPQRPGFKELDYVRGDWHLRDSYVGYFRAPGMTTVYYKDKPAWTMTYGGQGMTPSEYGVTKPTFNFLKSALMKVTPDLPYRGLKKFQEGEWLYEMDVNGGIEDFEGNERILKGNKMTFRQLFFGGIVISKDSDRNPVYPWDR
jgi:hypothetical protein